MTDKQTIAQITSAPTPTDKRTQHARILDTIARQGFISTWGAIHDPLLHCSKLSTRIGEIEAKHGHALVHEPQWHTIGGRRCRLGTRYSLPEGMTMEQFTNKA